MAPEKDASPEELPVAVYNGRYHGGWSNLHPSANATIALTSGHIKVLIPKEEIGPQPGAAGGKELSWTGVKSLRLERTLFGADSVGRAVYTEFAIGLADGSTVALDVPNVEPLEIWRALDRVHAFRHRIPDRIAAQLRDAAPASNASVATPPGDSTTVPTPAQPVKREKYVMPRRVKVLLAAVVVIVAAVVIGDHFTSGGPSADITHKVDRVAVLDSSHVRVWTTWTNTGKATGNASCAINVTAYNAFGDETGSGVDSTGPNNALKPGQSVNLYQDVVITNTDAAGVTSTKDVSITTC